MDDMFIRQFRKVRKRTSKLETKPWILYQESTYTPTYLGGTTAGVTTYTLQAGFWVRVGSLIFVKGVVIWTAATGTGNALVSLPFTASATANSYQSGSLRLTNVTFANSAPQMLINPSTGAFQMDSPLTNAAPTTVAIEAAGNIVFSATYFVD